MEKGLFSEAFFNLSIGLERLLKLIYIIDFALERGSFPSDKAMRKRGHDLRTLYDEAQVIRRRLGEQGTEFGFGLPDPTLAYRIVGVLGEFAMATRYYNLDYLVGDKRLGRDPVEAWTDDVARYLMSDYPARMRRRDEDWAAIAEFAIGDATIIRQETEGGVPLGTLSEAILHGRRGEWVQRNATFHCAVLIRDLVEVVWALSDRAGPNQGLQLPMLYEYFAVFYNDDAYLRRRKTFLD